VERTPNDFDDLSQAQEFHRHPDNPAPYCHKISEGKLNGLLTRCENKRPRSMIDQKILSAPHPCLWEGSNVKIQFTIEVSWDVAMLICLVFLPLL